MITPDGRTPSLGIHSEPGADPGSEGHSFYQGPPQCLAPEKVFSFWCELLAEVDEKDAPAVQEIIDEEKRHVCSLIEAKKRLKS
jgi:hypothetical protein